MSSSIQKKRLGTKQRLYRSKAELLHPELRAGSDRMEGI